MPFDERTMPSSRSVLTCKPAFPGGRFFPALVSLLRFTRDSNGSRRAILSPSAGACASVEDAADSADLGAADLALVFAVDFEACCASKREEPAASKIPTTRMFTERIVRSFRLHLSSWLRLRTRSGRGA